MSETPETDEIHVPGAPDIPGLTFRRYRGEADIPLVLALMAATDEADPAGRSISAAEVAGWVSPGESRSAIFAEIRGELAAFGRTYRYVTYSGEHIYGHSARVSPLYRRMGIGRALLRYLQSILMDIAQGDPGDAPKFFEVQVLGAETGWVRLLETEGYLPARTFYQMIRPNLEDVPSFPLPEGFEVRPAQPEHYRIILDALVEAFCHTWGASAPPADKHENFLHSERSQPELWQVAWDGDQVAGMVLAWIPFEENEEKGRRRGYTDPVVVLPKWQRRGLARALLSRSLTQLRERGLQEAALTVDSENPHDAVRLYESLGFQVANRMTLYRKAIGE